MKPFLLQVLPQSGCDRTASEAIYSRLCIALACFLMSAVCMAQTVEQVVDPGENGDQAVEASEQNAQPKFEQLPAEELREYVSQMKKLKPRKYHLASTKFIVRFVTPIVIAYKEFDAEKREAKWRKKIEKKNRRKNRKEIPADSAPRPEPYLNGVNFHGWRNHAGDYSEAVMIQVMPVPKLTGRAFLTGMLLGPGAVSGVQGGFVHRSKFVANFDRMELYRAGEKIAPLSAGRIPLVSENETEEALEDIVRYGSYRYPVSVFAPNARLAVKVFYQDKSGKSRHTIFNVTEKVRRQVWSDFENVSSAKR